MTAGGRPPLAAGDCRDGSARLLEPGGLAVAAVPAHALAPGRTRPTQLPRPRWRREGWVVRNEYPVAAAGRHPGGARRGGPAGTGPAVRARACWWCCSTPRVLALALVPGRAGVGRAAAAAALAKSARAPSASGSRPPSAAFFILPAVGFAAWSFARLAEEVERSRDLLITQTLRDAALTAGGSLRGGGPGVEERLRELSRRIDADLGALPGRAAGRHQHPGAGGSRRACRS